MSDSKWAMSLAWLRSRRAGVYDELIAALRACPPVLLNPPHVVGTIARVDDRHSSSLSEIHRLRLLLLAFDEHIARAEHERAVQAAKAKPKRNPVSSEKRAERAKVNEERRRRGDLMRAGQAAARRSRIEAQLLVKPTRMHSEPADVTAPVPISEVQTVEDNSGVTIIDADSLNRTAEILIGGYACVRPPARWGRRYEGFGQ